MPGPFESSAEDRTEAPSQFRREEFRRQGTVAQSRELMSVLGLLAVGGAIYLASSMALEEFRRLAQDFFRFSRIGPFGKAELLEMRLKLFKSWGWMVFPVFATAMAAGLVACAAQVGFYVTWEPLAPKWERLNPVSGFQRILSGQGIVEAVKAFIKIGIGGLVIWTFLKSQAPSAGHYFERSVPELTSLMLGTVMRLFFTLVLSLTVIGVLDYAWARWRLEKQMKMTRQEAKDEFKLREGDPLIKSRIKAMQRRVASRRMMEAVPKADVIVTNPTHFAVALKYDASQMSAPKVTAKGVDHIALKIREVARKHNVPIVENRPLARTLYKEIEIGHFVPRELYKAVAEVLAYVYRLRGRTA